MRARRRRPKSSSALQRRCCDAGEGSHGRGRPTRPPCSPPHFFLRPTDSTISTYPSAAYLTGRGLLHGHELWCLGARCGLSRLLGIMCQHGVRPDRARLAVPPRGHLCDAPNAHPFRACTSRVPPMRVLACALFLALLGTATRTTRAAPSQSVLS